MKVHILLNNKFGAALEKLRQEAKLSMPTKLKIKKLSKKFQDELKEVEELQKELLDLHLEKDAEGNPVQILDDEGNPTGNVKLKEESAQEFHQKRNELFMADVELDMKLTVKELETAESLTVEDLEILEDLISEE